MFLYSSFCYRLHLLQYVQVGYDDELVPFYTVKMRSDGREKGTIAERLRYANSLPINEILFVALLRAGTNDLLAVNDFLSILTGQFQRLLMALLTAWKETIYMAKFQPMTPSTTARAATGATALMVQTPPPPTTARMLLPLLLTWILH